MPKHPTPAQREASRRNGGKSHGPHDTSQTRFNALKHGLLSRKICFQSQEDRQVYQELHAGLVDDLRPVGMLEAMLVERLASAHCRQMRAIELRAWWELPRAAREAAYASGELVAGPWVFTSGTDNYARGGELLLRYEHELQRQFDQALRQLSVVRRQASGTAGTVGRARESAVGGRQSAVALGIVQRSEPAVGANGRTPSPQPSAPRANEGPAGARLTAPAAPAGAMNGAPTADGGVKPEAERPVGVAPRGKLQRIREARKQGKRGKRPFVVQDDPGGPAGVEGRPTQPLSIEEAEAFLDTLEKLRQTA